MQSLDAVSASVNPNGHSLILLAPTIPPQLSPLGSQRSKVRDPMETSNLGSLSLMFVCGSLIQSYQLLEAASLIVTGLGTHR